RRSCSAGRPRTTPRPSSWRRPTPPSPADHPATGRGRPAPGRHRDSGREHLSTRYAFVGLGHRAQMYVDALLGDWRDTGTIVGLCDVNTTRMAYYTERIGRPVPCYAPDEYGKMLESADAVVVCTVDATHAEYVVAALDAGLDVVVEKPLTVDAESCAAIAEAVERSPGMLVVTFTIRHSPLNNHANMYNH